MRHANHKPPGLHAAGSAPRTQGFSRDTRIIFNTLARCPPLRVADTPAQGEGGGERHAAMRQRCCGAAHAATRSNVLSRLKFARDLEIMRWRLPHLARLMWPDPLRKNRFLTPDFV